MVIQKFNRLIRNKWVWGIFAILISVFFAFDFLFYENRSNENVSAVGTLAGEDVDANLIAREIEDARGIGSQRNWDIPRHEVNKAAWENLASAKVAEKYNLLPSDDEMQNEIMAFCSMRRLVDQQGNFDFNLYSSFLQNYLKVTCAEFEGFLRRRITVQKAESVVPMSANWISPLEFEAAVNDQTDTFTIKIAAYTDKDVKVKKLDDAALRNYYNENTNSLALPDLISIRYFSVKADDPARLAKISVPSNEVLDLYDSVSSERYTTDTTNGPVTKAITEVYAELEKELKLINSLDIIKTNLVFRAYPTDEESRATSAKQNVFDKIAAEEKATVKTSPLFSVTSDRVVKGFMVPASTIIPGCREFVEKVAEIDPETIDLRYNVAVGEKEVHFIEIVKTEKARVPTFEESKNIIRPDAQKKAKAEAFKEFVNSKRGIAAGLIAKGKPFDAKSIGADNVSTSMTFTVESRPSFPDSREVVSAVVRLDKGQLSEFIQTANDRRGLLVYVEKREAGSDGKSALIRGGIQSGLGSAYGRMLQNSWREWNLNNMGFVPGKAYSITPEKTEEFE